MDSESTTSRGASLGAKIMGLILALVAAALLWGGIELALLGGSVYYLLAGLACLAVTVGLWLAKPWAGTLFGLFLLATLLWSLFESGMVAWALVARLVGPAILGLLVALVATGRSGRRAALGVSVLALAVVAVAFFLPHPESRFGVAPEGPPPAPVTEADWLHYGNDPGGSRYSPATDITPANVSKLQVAWSYDAGPGPTDTIPLLEAVPIEADGLVTYCTGKNDVIALDAATGKQAWRWNANVDFRGVVSTACRGVARHVTANATGPCAARIITATLDARMIALDAKTGQPCQDFGKNGQIDLTVGMGDVPKGYYYVTSAPGIIGDNAVVGGWVKDGQTTGEPSGVIRAFNVHTGKLAWAWDMGRPDKTGEPGPGEQYTRGTPNSWAPMSVDPKLNLVYLPTGNAGPDYTYHNRRPFDEKYTSSVVALDGTTGRVRWSFQTAHRDIWDYDVASQPTLFDLQTAKGVVPALAIGTKRAQLFVLDRRTGQPVHPVEERKVPQKAAPGETPSPTQPFAVGDLDFTGPGMSEKMMWGMTPLDQMVCRIRYRQAVYEGPATPIQLEKPTIIYPGYVGGMNWGSVTVDPARQLLLLATNRFAMYNKLLTREHANKLGMRAVKSGETGDLVHGQPMEGTRYAVDVQPFFSPLFMPCQQPPFSMVHAIDIRTGKLVWQHPFGDTRNAGPLGLKLGLALPMGMPHTGGSISTATGLMFIGASQDGTMRAIESRTGKVLWTVKLPFGGQATPMTYKLRNGKQYVVIAAGGSPGMALPAGNTVVAYALPD